MNSERSFPLLTIVALLLAAAAGLGYSALRYDGGPAASAQTDPTATAAASPSQSHSSRPPSSDITLRSDRASAASGERINLTGQVTGAGHSGLSLQVQEKRDGAWTDFPADGTTRSDGTFSTYVIFGRTGDHALRVTAPSTGQVSNPVTVTVG